MEQNLTRIFSRAIDLYEKGIQIEKEFAEARAENKPGKMQQLRIRHKTLEDQLTHLKKRLESKVTSQIVEVTFLYNNRVRHGQFVNWSDDEVYQYYNILGKFYQAKVVVKKIERHSTFISDVPLD